MKKLIFLLAVIAFVGFSSCKKDIISKPQQASAVVPPPPVQKVDAVTPSQGVTYDYQKAMMAKHTTLKTN